MTDRVTYLINSGLPAFSAWLEKHGYLDADVPFPSPIKIVKLAEQYAAEREAAAVDYILNHAAENNIEFCVKDYDDTPSHIHWLAVSAGDEGNDKTSLLKYIGFTND